MDLIGLAKPRDFSKKDLVNNVSENHKVNEAYLLVGPPGLEPGTKGL